MLDLSYNNCALYRNYIMHDILFNSEFTYTCKRPWYQNTLELFFHVNTLITMSYIQNIMKNIKFAMQLSRMKWRVTLLITIDVPIYHILFGNESAAYKWIIRILIRKKSSECMGIARKIMDFWPYVKSALRDMFCFTFTP